MQEKPGNHLKSTVTVAPRRNAQNALGSFYFQKKFVRTAGERDGLL